MTTAYRDTATRCRRCQRVTTGVMHMTMRWQDGLETVTVTEADLCRRCRYEIRDALARELAEKELNQWR